MMPKEELETKEAEIAEDGNIDKVRDILFGGQVRDFERKIAKLEERFSNELDGLRRDNANKLDKLEEYLRRELSGLTEKIREEENSRGEATTQLGVEMQKAAGELERKLADFAEKTSRYKNEIRTEILDKSKTITDTIQKKQDEIIYSMATESRALREEKADRVALADLFTEMAMRLSGELDNQDSE